MVGKIEVPKGTKIEAKDKSVKTFTELLDADQKSEKEEDLEGKNLTENINHEADSALKNDQFIKAKDTSSLSEPKHLDDIDANKSIKSDSLSKVKPVEEEKPVVQNEQEVLRAKSEQFLAKVNRSSYRFRAI